MSLKADLVLRWVVAGAVLLALPAFLLLPLIAPKPWPLPAPGTGTIKVQLYYHEPLGDYRDADAARARIYAQAQRDCEAAGKSFQKRCVVNTVRVSAPEDEGGQIPPILTGHAELTLYPDDKPASAKPN
jgi:hypothetical protein